MSDILTAMAQHTADVGRVYLQNAILDRGIPNDPGRIKIDPLTIPVAPTAPVVPATPSPVLPVATPSNLPVSAPNRGLLSGLLPLAVPLLLSGLLSGGSVAGLGWLLSQRNVTPNEPTIVQPYPPAEKDGSLLQYLEDKGYHLPPEKRPK